MLIVLVVVAISPRHPPQRTYRVLPRIHVLVDAPILLSIGNGRVSSRDSYRSGKDICIMIISSRDFYSGIDSNGGNLRRERRGGRAKIILEH